MSALLRRLQESPFLVLELGPEASRLEIERAGQRLLSMLELGLEAAKTYPTPWGPAPRDASLVRAAMAELRDPARRAGHVPPGELPEPADPPLDPAWEGAKAALGWSGL